MVVESGRGESVFLLDTALAGKAIGARLAIEEAVALLLFAVTLSTTVLPENASSGANVVSIIKNIRKFF